MILKTKHWSIGLVALISLLVFILPLIAASIFSFRGAGGKGYSLTNYQWLIEQDGFWPTLGTSLKLGLLAAILNIALMLPTLIYIQLKAIHLKPVINFLCILPLVIPVVSLAIGAQVAMPEFLQNSEYELVFFFVIIALPFTFRALDNSISGIPLATLVEASRSLGASWIVTIVKVIAPSIKSGIYGSLFLSFALAIGEFTITSLLHWETFPTWTIVVSQQNILGAIAISIFSFVGAIFVLTIVGLFSHRNKEQK